jgi:hypothetical protein
VTCRYGRRRGGAHRFPRLCHPDGEVAKLTAYMSPPSKDLTTRSTPIMQFSTLLHGTLFSSGNYSALIAKPYP